MPQKYYKTNVKYVIAFKLWKILQNVLFNI